MKKCKFAGLAVLITWAAFNGAPWSANRAKAAPISKQEYKLAPDDVLDITVDNHDDLNRTVTIRRDGKISLPLGPEVMAAGKTTTGLAREIKANFSKYLNNLDVGVSLKQAHLQLARIFGAVKIAGSYEVKPNWRVMDLIAVAGGLTANPNRISGHVVRPDGSELQLDILHASQDMASDSNVPVHPDDLVFLTQQETARQIHIIGDVKVPGAYDLDENLTLVGLIAEAGGPTDAAALRKVYVARGAQQIQFDLFQALAEGKPSSDIVNFQFQPGDTVVVPQNSESVAIMGQVQKPGYYMLTEDKHAATVFKTLALAGGQLPTADLEHAEITRTIDGVQTKIPVNLIALSKGDAASDPELEPDDVVYLPQSQVRIIGMVTKPGAYNINDQTTIISVLADAGGLLNGAGASKAYVMRGDDRLSINIHDALSGSPDADVVNFKLQNDDILVIPDITNQVQVTGEVIKPGLFNLDDSLTLASLVTSAGGVLADGALNLAYITRNGKKIPLTDCSLASEQLKPVDINVKFEPGDVLTVPRNPIHYVVIGAVKFQGYYYFMPGTREISIVDALASAGGTGDNSNLSRTILVRNNVAIPIDANGLMHGGNGHGITTIIPGDVLYVPTRINNTNKLNLLTTGILGMANLLY